jgi:hypothetical protein
MILQIFHDRRSLEDVAALKAALKDCYGAFGLQVQERGFLYVPIPGLETNAALLLKYLDRATGKVRALWLVDRELHYTGICPVFGCSAGHAALLCAALEPEVLANEGVHEVGYLLGMEHCRNCCVMSHSD